MGFKRLGAETNLDVSERGAVAFPAHRGSWLGEHAPDVVLGMGGFHFVGAFLLHYQYPSSSGHLDGFNGEQRRSLSCQNAVPLPFQHMEVAGWENTLLMRRWEWGGVSFVCAFISCSITNTHRALDIWMGLTGSEQRRSLSCQNAVPLPFQHIAAAGWENTLQMWRWGWGGFHFVGAFLLHYRYPSSPGHLDGFKRLGAETNLDVSECGAVAFPAK